MGYTILICRALASKWDIMQHNMVLQALALLNMKLSHEDRLWAIDMLEAELDTTQVAAHLGTSERSVRD